MPFQGIDLHTHSTASDGTDTPRQLVQNAVAASLAALALTDHDTLSGLDEAEEAAAGQLEFIRGCELGVQTACGEMHILGLWIPHQCAELENALAKIRILRGQRNLQMIEKLCALGYLIRYEEVQEEAHGESIGRPHIAAVLLKKHYVHSHAEAFQRFLNSNGAAYVPRALLSPEQAIRLLVECGASVALAHPLSGSWSRSWLEAQLESYKHYGLSALEVYYSEYSQKDERYLVGLADQMHLAYTGGSDYHGAHKKNIKLGSGYGSLRVPQFVLEKLKQSRRG